MGRLQPCLAIAARAAVAAARQLRPTDASLVTPVATSTLMHTAANPPGVAAPSQSAVHQLHMRGFVSPSSALSVTADARASEGGAHRNTHPSAREGGPAAVEPGQGSTSEIDKVIAPRGPNSSATASSPEEREDPATPDDSAVPEYVAKDRKQAGADPSTPTADIAPAQEDA